MNRSAGVPPQAPAHQTAPEWATWLALSALALVGLHPFAYTSLATSFDGLLHLYRLVELEHLLSQGLLFPRWAPDFVFGFGYPLFNFYAPLAYYLSVLIHWLGFSFVDSATLFFILCTLAAGGTMYRLARAMFNDTPASLVAALAYIYAPTHIYDNFYRSAWATVLAYAIAPVCLWAVWQWYALAQRRYLGWLALAVAALMLSHNVSALLLMPIVGLAALAWGVLAFPIKNQPQWVWLSFKVGRSAGLRVILSVLAIVFGLMLSAFFWLPALVETTYVQTWRLTIPPDFDFRNHFLMMGDWFAWPAPAEVGRINPDLVNTVGPINLGVALIAVLLEMGRVFLRSNSKFQIPNSQPLPPDFHPPSVAVNLFFACLLALSLWMTLPQSTWLWERVGLLPSIQFPHRLLTVSALCCALLCGVFIHALRPSWRLAMSMGVCMLLIVQAIPFLYPRPQPAIGPNPTLADMLAHEHKTGALGTTASGEYFPVWVKFVPRNSPFEEAVGNGENPQRFEARSLPVGGRVITQSRAPLSYALTVTSPAPFRATFRHFYFPGWQGYVDGNPVETLPSDNQGFATFDVPAGERRIALTFTSTPIRDFGAALSLGSATLGGLYGLYWAFARVAAWRQSLMSLRWSFRPTMLRTALQPMMPYVLLGVLLFLSKWLFVDRFDSPLRVAFDGVRVHGLQYPRQIDLSGVMFWHGYNLRQREQTLDLTLYWQAQQTTDVVYSAFAQLVDEQSNLYAQKDNLHPGSAPTTTWRPREYNVDRHVIEIPAGTPPGNYQIAIGLYDPRNGARLLRTDAAQGEPPDQIRIGPVQILSPPQLPTITDLQIAQPLTRSWPGQLTLLGLTQPQTKLPSDDFLRTALYWRADGATLPALTMTLRLVDAQGREVAKQQGAPSNNRYPTTRWRQGELVRDNRSLWIPKTMPNGTYTLQLQLDGDASWLNLQTIGK